MQKGVEGEEESLLSRGFCPSGGTREPLPFPASSPPLHPPCMLTRSASKDSSLCQGVFSQMDAAYLHPGGVLDFIQATLISWLNKPKLRKATRPISLRGESPVSNV